MNTLDKLMLTRFLLTFIVSVVVCITDAIRDSGVDRKMGYVLWHVVKKISFYLPFIVIYYYLFAYFKLSYCLIFTIVSIIVCFITWKLTYLGLTKPKTGGCMRIISFIVKRLGKVLAKVLPWETVLGMLLEMAFKLLSDYLTQLEMTRKAKLFTIGVYALAVGFGKDLVDDTRTSYDDYINDGVLATCKELSIKFDFVLPDIVLPKTT